MRGAKAYMFHGERKQSSLLSKEGCRDRGPMWFREHVGERKKRGRRYSNGRRKGSREKKSKMRRGVSVLSRWVGRSRKPCKNSDMCV